MQNIKFRAWQKSHKRMLPVEQMNFNKNSTTVDYGEKAVPMINTFNTDSFILMSHTGIRDIANIEIYETDIVKAIPKVNEPDCYSFTGQVTWDEATASFCLVWMYPDGDWSYENFDIYKYIYEVLGNTYENPILIEKIIGVFN